MRFTEGSSGRFLELETERSGDVWFSTPSGGVFLSVEQVKVLFDRLSQHLTRLRQQDNDYIETLQRHVNDAAPRYVTEEDFKDNISSIACDFGELQRRIEALEERVK